MNTKIQSPASKSDHEQLMELVKLKDIATIEEALQIMPLQSVYPFIADLLRGNGFAVSFHYRLNHVSHIVLSLPGAPGKTVMLLKFSGFLHPLSMQQVREELIYMERTLSVQYNCKQFCILSAGGFENDAMQFEQLNVLLHDKTWIHELIHDYTPGSTHAKITLFAHNQRTYRKIINRFKEHKSVAVVQATGTGKSFLIARLLQQFSSVNAVVMAPSWHILNQMREHIHFPSGHITYITYAKCMNMTEAEAAALNPGFIVLDEFHRCGADEWGRGVEQVLRLFPQAYKFGTSATPVRYTDNQRDMALELFDGNIAENLNLAQAIARNILPMPKYVCALYSLKEEAELLRTRIQNNTRNASKKEDFLSLLDKSVIDWEASKGVPEILRKHLGKHAGKFIVFCNNEEHLKEMEKLVPDWFREAQPGKKISSHRVFHNEQNNEQTLLQFRSADKDNSIHLLFTVNMLNEGVHIPGIDGVILLRPTESPNIFYQQIGRALKVGQNHVPVIFDLVNNFKNIRSFDFLNDLNVSFRLWNNLRDELGMDGQTMSFTIHDEVREIVNLFGEIEFNLSSWDDMFEKLVEYKKQNGHTLVPQRYEADEQLGKWVGTQRKAYKAGYMLPERHEKLKAAGFIFDVFEYDWEVNYQKLIEYKNFNGHCNVPARYKLDPSFARWANTNRQTFKAGKLSQERTTRLVKSGFVFDLLNEGWEEMFQQLLEFKKQNGHFYPVKKGTQHSALHQWTNKQRHDYRKNKLSVQRVEKLRAANFTFQLKYDLQWDLMINRFVEYKLKYGTTIVSEAHDLKLSAWMHQTRNNFNKGRLSEEKIKQLQSIDFCFDSTKTQWNEYFERLTAFKKEHGHCNVNEKSEKKEYRSLAVWLRRQKNAIVNNDISEDSRKKLFELGVEVNPGDNKWNRQYEELCRYKQQFGEVNSIPRKREYIKLHEWVSSQRRSMRSGKMDPDHKAKVELLGVLSNFGEDKKQSSWADKYKRLLLFKQTYRHCNVPLNWEADPQLGTWVAGMRARKAKGLLSEERLRLLNEAGITWEFERERWNDYFPMLKEFKKEHGHCMVTNLYSKNAAFDSWVYAIRKLFIKKQLSPERMKLLEELGFENHITKKDELRWLQKFEMMHAFHAKHGNCRVPMVYDGSRTLNTWMIHQREYYHKGWLTTEQVQKLDELKFEWSPMETGWENMFSKLIEYKTANNIQVVHRILNDDALAHWLARQRKLLKANKLSENQTFRLRQAGVIDNPRDFEWEQQFNKLCSFREKYHHTNITVSGENRTLAKWADSQRERYNKKMLSPEQIQKLQSIDFSWTCTWTDHKQWDALYEKASLYYKLKGHLCIPRNNMELAELRNWVYQQRRLRNVEKLPVEKIKKLELLNFPWQGYSHLPKGYRDYAKEKLKNKNMKKA